MRTGDLLGSGTISGSDSKSMGSLLELAWNGENPIELDDGTIRTFLDDGDTITFNLPGLHPIIDEKISIRVNGIDTPEIKGKCEKEKYDAKQAKVMVADILKDAELIVLKNMERGKYFRIAADVFVDGENLADMLIEAWIYLHKADSFLAHLFQQAEYGVSCQYYPRW